MAELLHIKCLFKHYFRVLHKILKRATFLCAVKLLNFKEGIQKSPCIVYKGISAHFDEVGSHLFKKIMSIHLK